MATTRARRESRPIPEWVGLAKTIVLDIAGPLVVYQVAHRAGMDQVPALLLSGIPPVIGVLLEFALKRRAEALGLFVIAGIAVGALLGLLTDDPRLYLLEGAAKTGAMALVFAGSAALGKPALFLFWQGSWGGPDTARGQWLGEQYATNPGMHRLLRNGTYAFAAMLALIAVSDVIVTQTASVETSLLWNRIDFVPGVVIFTVLWMVLFVRAQRRGDVDFETIPGKGPADREKDDEAREKAETPEKAQTPEKTEAPENTETSTTTPETGHTAPHDRR